MKEASTEEQNRAELQAAEELRKEWLLPRRENEAARVYRHNIEAKARVKAQARRLEESRAKARRQTRIVCVWVLTVIVASEVAMFIGFSIGLGAGVGG